MFLFLWLFFCLFVCVLVNSVGVCVIILFMVRGWHGTTYFGLALVFLRL